MREFREVHILIGKRVIVYKSIVALLILFYIVMSCFPCTRSNTWNTFLEEDGPTIRSSNNISITMVVALTLQIVLLVLNRSFLQLLAGIIGLFSGIMLPLAVAAMNALNDAICGMGSYPDKVITPFGWIVTFLSWVLLGFDIWLAVAIRRSRVAAIIPAEYNAEERV